MSRMPRLCFAALALVVADWPPRWASWRMRAMLWRIHDVTLLTELPAFSVTVQSLMSPQMPLETVIAPVLSLLPEAMDVTVFSLFPVADVTMLQATVPANVQTVITLFPEMDATRLPATVFRPVLSLLREVMDVTMLPETVLTTLLVTMLPATLVPVETIVLPLSNLVYQLEMSFGTLVAVLTVSLLPGMNYVALLFLLFAAVTVPRDK